MLNDFRKDNFIRLLPVGLSTLRVFAIGRLFLIFFWSGKSFLRNHSILDQNAQFMCKYIFVDQEVPAHHRICHSLGVFLFF